MANDLLVSFKAVSQAHRHVVFNERTQEFERAGKRHAIASFFGSADARAKNYLTLQKIKEALCAEVSDGGRFSGYGKVSDGIFAGLDGCRRIKSSAVDAIIRKFRQEAASAPDRLRELKDAAAKAILDDCATLSFGPADRLALMEGRDGWTEGSAKTLNPPEGRRAVLEMVTRQLIDSELSGRPVAVAIDELGRFQEGKGSSEAADAVKARLAGFFEAINGNPEAQKSFLAILNLVDGRESARFTQLAGCQLARTAAAFCSNPGFDVQEALGRLCSKLGELNTAQNALLEMEAVPIGTDSFELALDFGGWEDGARIDCLNVLARQPVDSRIPLLAAMKAFGGSRDVLLLHRLAGVQDSIKDLYAYGNLSPESIYRAIEGEMVEVPDFIENETMTIRGEEQLSGYYGRVAADEIDAAIAKTDWSPEKRAMARAEGMRLIRSYGVPARDVMACISEVDSRYPVFSGERYWSVVGMRVALGECFDNMSSGVKYNLLTVPDGYRRPLMEAFMLATGGNSYDDRLLHLLVARKDEIMDLWNTGRLTKANVLQTVAAERAGMQEPASKINPYYQTICPEFGSGVDEAVGRLAESLKNENEFMIAIDSPRFDRVTFCSREGRGSSGRIEEADRHSKDIGSVMELLCGEKNREQVVMALAGMASAAKQVLLPHFVSNGAENRSLVFNPLYEISVEESGDLELRITNLRRSGIFLDWTITIHPDGTHSATEPVVRMQDP